MLTEANEVSFQLDSFDPVLQQEKRKQYTAETFIRRRLYDSERSVTAWLYANCLALFLHLCICLCAYMETNRSLDIKEMGLAFSNRRPGCYFLYKELLCS